MSRLIAAAALVTGLVVLSVVVVPSLTTTGSVITPVHAASSTVSIPNPIKCNDATCIISQVIRYILGVIAVIATLMFIWGGVMMLTSAGNADRVRQAKETLAWAAIGIVVILMSWGIIRFVLAGLLNTQK